MVLPWHLGKQMTRWYRRICALSLSDVSWVIPFMCLYVLSEYGGMSVCYGVMCICVGVVSTQVIASLKSRLLVIECLRFSHLHYTLDYKWNVVITTDLTVELIPLVHALVFCTASFTPWTLSWSLSLAGDHMTPPFDLLPLCSIAFIYSGLDVCLWDLNTYSYDSHPCVDYVDSFNCKSYSPDQVKHILNNNNFSLLHLNTRSLQKHHDD